MEHPDLTDICLQTILVHRGIDPGRFEFKQHRIHNTISTFQIALMYLYLQSEVLVFEANVKRILTLKIKTKPNNNEYQLYSTNI